MNEALASVVFDILVAEAGASESLSALAQQLARMSPVERMAWANARETEIS